MASLSSNPSSLSQKRRTIETQWSRFIAGSPFLKAANVRTDIVESWQRSATNIEPQSNLQAPCDDEVTASQLWQDSLLCQAAQREQQNMVQLAREGELVAAIADPTGRLLWTFASRHMRSRAESVNFTAGGHWDERSVGTNAIGLSMRLRRSVTVFSSEHYLPFVHDWVCYAAPITHPQTGEVLGILDLSTTWKRHTPLGPAAVTELARNIGACLPNEMPRAELEIHALGQPRVLFRGKTLTLSKRQLEILCLLVLNPQGLALDNFHAVLYGDSAVSTSTLKAELSHLRKILDGQIGSRPYRLMAPVWADFVEIWQLLRDQKAAKALSLYRGAFLPWSASPEIEEWRHCIDAVMEQNLGTCEDTSMLINGICDQSISNEMVLNRLAELVEGNN